MSGISEKIELLGKGLYKNIPDELTIKAMPTISELDYVGSEDFDKTMLDSIFPQVIEEKINYRELLQIDYFWICRCLRILNYGPYFTTNAIYCPDCNHTSYGEYSVNLETIECDPLPDNFVNSIIISKGEFLDFNKDIEFVLPTIGRILSANKDKAFKRIGDTEGRIDTYFASICYSIVRIGDKKGLTPLEVKLTIEDEMSAADFRLLRNIVDEKQSYGMKVQGTTTCPKCGGNDAHFIALVDDRFFRPTSRDLREWKNNRSARKIVDISGSKKAPV